MAGRPPPPSAPARGPAPRPPPPFSGPVFPHLASAPAPAAGNPYGQSSYNYAAPVQYMGPAVAAAPVSAGPRPPPPQAPPRKAAPRPPPPNAAPEPAAKAKPAPSRPARPTKKTHVSSSSTASIGGEDRLSEAPPVPARDVRKRTLRAQRRSETDGAGEERTSSSHGTSPVTSPVTSPPTPGPRGLSFAEPELQQQPQQQQPRQQQQWQQQQQEQHVEEDEDFGVDEQDYIGRPSSYRPSRVSLASERISGMRDSSLEFRAACVLQSWARGVLGRSRVRAELKAHRYRTKVVRELYDTEVSYCAALQVLIDVVYQPLMWNAKISETPTVTSSDLQLIFGNIEQIVQLNVQFREDVKERLMLWYCNQGVGDVFLRFAPFFKVYGMFCKNYDDSNAKLQSIQSGARFQQFWEPIRSLHGIGTLQSLLIQPVQRIPRYVLLLKDLIRHTDAAHPDYQNLVDALEAMEGIGVTVDSSVMAPGAGGGEGSDMIFAQQLFGAFVEVLKPARSLLRRGPAKRLKHDATLESVWIWIFTDLVIVADFLGDDQYTYIAHVTLFDDDGENPAIIQELPDMQFVRNAFRITGAEDAFTICALSPDDKRLWMEALMQATEVQEADLGRRTRAGEVAPSSQTQATALVSAESRKDYDRMPQDDSHLIEEANEPPPARGARGGFIHRDSALERTRQRAQIRNQHTNTSSISPPGPGGGIMSGSPGAPSMIDQAAEPPIMPLGGAQSQPGTTAAGGAAGSPTGGRPRGPSDPLAPPGILRSQASPMIMRRQTSFRVQDGVRANPITAKVLGTATRQDARGKQYTVYVIEVVGVHGNRVRIQKRYSEFDTLDKQLRTAFPNAKFAAMPPKHYISHSPKLIENRVIALGLYLQRVLLSREIRECPMVRQFLEDRDGQMTGCPPLHISAARPTPGVASSGADNDGDGEGGAPGRNTSPFARERSFRNRVSVAASQGSSGSSQWAVTDEVMQTARQIRVPDGNDVECEMDADTRTERVLVTVLRQLGLRKELRQGFGLFVMCNTETAESSNILFDRPLDSNEFPLRVLANRYALDNTARLEVRKSSWMDTDMQAVGRNETFSVMLMSQVWRDIVSSKYPCSVVDVVTMSALNAQSLLGDYGPTKGTMYTNGTLNLPQQFRPALALPSPNSVPLLAGGVELEFYILTDTVEDNPLPRLLKLWSPVRGMVPLVVQAWHNHDLNRWTHELRNTVAGLGPESSSDPDLGSVIQQLLNNTGGSRKSTARHFQQVALKYVKGESLARVEGWLTKESRNRGMRSGLARNWRTRWFALVDDCLLYFKTQPQFVPRPEFWRDSVTHAWRKISGMTKLVAATQFLRIAQEYPWFGTTMFRTSYERGSNPDFDDLPTGVTLGITQHCIRLLDPITKVMYLEVADSDTQDLQAFPAHLALTLVGDDRALIFKTPIAYDVVRVYNAFRGDDDDAELSQTALILSNDDGEDEDDDDASDAGVNVPSYVSDPVRARLQNLTFPIQVAQHGQQLSLHHGMGPTTAVEGVGTGAVPGRDSGMVGSNGGIKPRRVGGNMNMRTATMATGPGAEDYRMDDPGMTPFMSPASSHGKTMGPMGGSGEPTSVGSASGAAVAGGGSGEGGEQRRGLLSRMFSRNGKRDDDAGDGRRRGKSETPKKRRGKGRRRSMSYPNPNMPNANDLPTSLAETAEPEPERMRAPAPVHGGPRNPNLLAATLAAEAMRKRQEQAAKTDGLPPRPHEY